jgi:hypothetical protein
MEEKADINATLIERGKVHGKFEDHALYSQVLKSTMRLQTPKWGS